MGRRFCLIGCIVASLLVFGGVARGGFTERVSVSSTGEQGNDSSMNGRVSGDGRYVAFSSGATNLVPGDTNGAADIFVRDRGTGTTERVSVGSAGEQANSGSAEPSISADGRYVAFTSSASNLVAGDTNDEVDVFVHDRATGITERVSVSSAGEQGNDHTSNAVLSADGGCVAFSSSASNLVPDDTNGQPDFFVRDRVAGTTERVTVSSAGEEGDDVSAGCSGISGDGRYVAFPSFASNLVVGDTNQDPDIFVRDRVLGTTERVSVSSSGAQGTGYSTAFDSYGISMSADGRYVEFPSDATNLVGGDPRYCVDVFVRDRVVGTTERVSAGYAGNRGAVISSDGRYVLFGSPVDQGPPDDPYIQPDVFVYDRVTHLAEMVSVSSQGEQANQSSCGRGGLSSDGRVAAFFSCASNLVTGAATAGRTSSYGPAGGSSTSSAATGPPTRSWPA
jgi:Tol biopolymer transport system component